MNIKVLFSSKIVLLGLVVLLGFLGSLKYRQWRDQKSIEKEKQSLQQQTDALEKKNKELENSLSYLNSSSFKERVARQQLNLKKTGEIVYSFSENSGADDGGTSALANKKIGNLEKWWNYFTNSN